VSMFDRINQSIQKEPDPLRRSEWLAKLGCYLARVGDLEAATSALQELRSSGAFLADGRVAVRGMLLEGLIGFYGSLDPRSSDRVLRANALAKAGDAQDLDDLTNAWLAHFDFNANAFARCGERLASVMHRRTAFEDESALRAWLVFADMNLLCGRVARAKEFYERARRAAVAQGDQASMAAMFYNKAALSLSLVRADAASGAGLGGTGALHFLQSEIASAASYHRGAGQTSLGQLLDWMGARAKLEAKDYSGAVDAYRDLMATETVQNTSADGSLVCAEFAEALLQSGAVEEAIAVAARLLDVTPDPSSFDDSLLVDDFKARFNAALGQRSPFSGQCVDIGLARQQYIQQVERVRGVADAVEARLASTGNG
jgi:hypothetical protein